MPHLVATLIYLSQMYAYYIRGDRSPLKVSIYCRLPSPCSDGGPGAVVKATCLESHRARARAPVWPLIFTHS